jgi:hypothetical protein
MNENLKKQKQNAWRQKFAKFGVKNFANCPKMKSEK